MNGKVMSVDEGTKKFLRTKIIKYGINPVHSDAAQLLCRQKPTVCTLRIQWMLCPIRPCKSWTAPTYAHLVDIRNGPGHLRRWPAEFKYTPPHNKPDWMTSKADV